MNRQKGFSLIEFLIVVVIIGIIAAIAIPNLLMARRDANQRQAALNMHTLLKREKDCTPPNICAFDATALPHPGSYNYSPGYDNYGKIQIVATPKTPTTSTFRDGNYSYYIDGNDVVYRKLGDSPPTQNQIETGGKDIERDPSETK